MFFERNVDHIFHSPYSWRVEGKFHEIEKLKHISRRKNVAMRYTNSLGEMLLRKGFKCEKASVYAEK